MTRLIPFLMALPIGAMLLFLATIPATAQSACDAYDALAKTLSERYGEVRQTMAHDGGGNLIEQWANPETGTWTATLTTQGGISCIVAAGENWRLAPQGDET